jgi:hypothetical protein
VKPLPIRKRASKEPTQAKSNPKLYLYAAGALLFVILAGIALA